MGSFVLSFAVSSYWQRKKKEREVRYESRQERIRLRLRLSSWERRLLSERHMSVSSLGLVRVPLGVLHLLQDLVGEKSPSYTVRTAWRLVHWEKLWCLAWIPLGGS